MAPPVQQYGAAGAMPPTPGTGDPFLTPMAQSQNLGVSYFNDGTASPGPSGTNSASQYSGLPEPQYADNAGGMGMGMGAAAGMAMPTPRRDSYQPRPLPMSVTPINGNNNNNNNNSGTDSTRPWSGYLASQPPAGMSQGAYMHSPEIQSEPSGWSNPTSSMNTGYAPYGGGAVNAGYGQDRPAQGGAASTMYQPSSHGGYDESLLARSPPPPASPPPDVYGGMASSSAYPTGKEGGLPSGAAAPTMYAPGEKQVYRPY